MKYIKIDSDYWEDVNKIWFVIEYERIQNSTGVRLVLEDNDNGNIIHRTIPQNQIYWLEDKDW